MISLANITYAVNGHFTATNGVNGIRDILYTSYYKLRGIEHFKKFK
jgi:hypothetical protein